MPSFRYKFRQIIFIGIAATLATIEMTNAMADGGADVALVITPSFYKNQMNSTALLHHYLTVSYKKSISLCWV